MNEPERIYIAGPYTTSKEGKIVVNVHTAEDVAGALFLMGHFPYVPHALHWADRRFQQFDFNLTYEECLQWGVGWLDVCDSLFLIAHSKGADKELKIAQDKGLKIYTRIVDVPNLTNRHNEVGKYFGHLQCFFSSAHINRELL